MRMKVEGEHGKRRETFHFKKGNRFAFRCVKAVEECGFEPDTKEEVHTHTHTNLRISLASKPQLLALISHGNQSQRDQHRVPCEALYLILKSNSSLSITELVKRNVFIGVSDLSGSKICILYHSCAISPSPKLFCYF